MMGAPSLNSDPEEGRPLHLLRRREVLHLTPCQHHHEAPSHLLLLRNLKGRQVSGEVGREGAWGGWVERMSGEGGWRGCMGRVGREGAWGGWVERMSGEGGWRG